MSSALNFIFKEATSLLRSEIRAGVKKAGRSFLGKTFAKSEKDIQKEMDETLGFTTSHFSLDKKNNIVYKPSSLFLQEWLMKSPLVGGKLIRDEESNITYLDGQPLTSAMKLSLLANFMHSTNIKSASLPSQFDAALKMIDPTDRNASLFKERFAGWNKDQPSVINSWMTNCFGEGMDSNPAYATLLFRKWIIGTARRAMTPGSLLDGCFIIAGPGGKGKTQFFRQLLPEPFHNRSAEIYCDLKNAQRFTENILGHTIVSFDELSALDIPKTEEIFKQLLSSQSITTRLAYRRNPQTYLIRQGFSGTTNKKQFIPDQFFSRRLWICQLNGKTMLNFDYLFANREALWKEAVYYALQNESCFLTPEEQKTVEEYNQRFIKEQPAKLKAAE